MRRLGAAVTMVGSVGDDLFGQQLLEPLQAAGMDISHVVVHTGIHSGVGHVTLEVTEHTRPEPHCGDPRCQPDVDGG